MTNPQNKMSISILSQTMISKIKNGIIKYFSLEFVPSVVLRSGHTNDNTMRRATQFLEKYTSHFIWKVCVWKGVGDRTELQHIDPHSYGHQHYVFLVLQGCSTGGPGTQLSAGGRFLYSSISPTLLIPKTQSGVPRAPSAGCWLSLPHLVTNGSVFTELYSSLTPPTSCGRHNCTHSTHPQSGL